MSKSVWEFYKNSSEPFRQACVAEWQRWLEEVKPKAARRKLESRLQSDKNNDHFSARMELYFHHYFKSRGCEIEIEPDLPGRDDHPDFLIHHDSEQFFLEARISEQEDRFLYQEQFADSLREALGNMITAHTIDLDVSIELPSLDYISEIASFVAEEMVKFDGTDEEEAAVEWGKQIMGKAYRLQFMLKRGMGIRRPLRVGQNLWVVSGGTAGLGDRLYAHVGEKAKKYGEHDKPFVIAVWNQGFSGEEIEKAALYGQISIPIGEDESSRSVSRRAGRRNGIFTTARENRWAHDKVSVVVIYGFRLDVGGPQHNLRVYHNPLASYPLSPDVFKDEPQLIPTRITDGFDIGTWTLPAPRP